MNIELTRTLKAKVWLYSTGVRVKHWNWKDTLHIEGWGHYWFEKVGEDDNTMEEGE